VVLDGPADAQGLLIVSSACHGVEGYCGSGVQITLLQYQALRQAAHHQGVALLFVHALNPYGFSWWRRTTHENVDLNRNFQDFSQPLPRNTGYDDIAHLLVPPTWPPQPDIEQAVAQYIATQGMAAWQAAMSGGQYHHPEGLFYGGHNPTWSQHTLRQVLREHAQRCQRLGWIDLHTGLGPCGVGERIYAGRQDAEGEARARQWWGGPDGRGVTSIYDGSSTSALLTGMMWLSAYQECPQAEYTGLALEYGTRPSMEMLNALRAEQWAENHPEAPVEQRQAIKRQMRDAFYVDTDEWKQQVLDQALDATRQAINGLAQA
jgi:hypothetical protein